MKYLTLLLALIATPAFSTDICDDLWFTRNLVFDRAGYCFNSQLGQEIFDNTGCTTNSPQFSPKDAKLVALVKQREQFWECRATTSRKTLDVDLLQTRMQLQDLPVINEDNLFACHQWQGPKITLRAAHNAASDSLGKAQNGDELFFSHDDIDGWMFVAAAKAGRKDRIGWAKLDITYLQSHCDYLYP